MKARCPACDKELTLTVEGTLPSHRITECVSMYCSDPMEHLSCRGSGRVPSELRDELKREDG